MEMKINQASNRGKIQNRKEEDEERGLKEWRKMRKRKEEDEEERLKEG